MNIINVDINQVGSRTSSTVDDNFDLNRSILKFIRLRESAQFRAEIRKKDYGQQSTSLRDKIKKFVSKVESQNAKNDSPKASTEIEEFDCDGWVDSDEDMLISDSDEESFSSKKFKIKLEESSTWSQVWRKISDYLDDIRENDIDEYLTYFTAIIKLHVEHKIILHHACLISLTNCIEPAHIQNIFNMELIDTIDPFNLDCIFEQRVVFNSLKADYFIIGSSEPFYLIMSLAILIYKSRCMKFAKAINSGLCKNLASFINRKHFDESFKDKGVKHFLKACILNGILSKTALNNFLSIPERDHNRNHMRDDDDSVDSSEMSDEDDGSSDEMDLHMDDSDEEESDDSEREERRNEREMMRRIQPHNRHQHRDMNNNNEPIDNNNNNNARQNRPVVRIINNINANTDQLKSLYPLSLKNLARIKIKNTIKNYVPSSIDQLTILPDILKKFVLFEDEVELILKLTVKLPKTS